MNLIKKKLFEILEKRKSTSDAELYLFTLLITVGVASCFLLLFFVPFQISIASVPLFIAGIVGILIYIFTIRLVYKKHYDLAGIVQVATNSLFCLFTLWQLGKNYYLILYFITALIMILIIPFQNHRIKPVFIFVHFLISLFAFYLELFYTPSKIYPVNHFFFTTSNFLICFFAILVFVSLEKGIRSFLDAFRVQQLKDLRTQANLDPLTQLYNRRFADAYFEKLANSEAEHENNCIAIADLDNFKNVNDIYGHDAGDIVLSKISEIMLHSIRKSDYLFRWGGEEFLLVLGGVTLAEGAARLEELRKKIENLEIKYQEQIIPITITMGLSVLDNQDVTGSIKRCDEKLYQGKRTGKNIVVF